MSSQDGAGSESPITLSKLFLQKVALLKDTICLQAIREKFPDVDKKDLAPKNPISL